MDKLSVVRRYFDIYFNTHQFNELHDVFTDTMTFEGPLYHFNNAQEYIDSLEDIPCDSCSFRVIEEFEKERSVCVIYEFEKNGKRVLMSQLFGFNDGKISKIRLIFNTEDFH